jgi:hypothetical protein
MLKTISNEWRRARDQFARVGSLSTVVLALTAAPPAEAAIIKLLCVSYIKSPCVRSDTCGQRVEEIITVDTAKNLVAGIPAEITDDDMYAHSEVAGIKTKHININRKTGAYHYYSDEGPGRTTVRDGTCQPAPGNIF